MARLMKKSVFGHHSLTPYFTVRHADDFIIFVSRVFNATVFKDSRHADGTLQHARLLIEDSVIMLNEACDDYPPNMSQMHLYVSDSDQTYECALQHGATSLMAPMMRPHGDRMAGFCDPFGNIWWVAERRGEKRSS